MSATAPAPTASGPSPFRRLALGVLGTAVSLLLLAGILIAAELVFRAQADRLGFDPERLARAREYVCRGWVDEYAPRAHSIFRHPPDHPLSNKDGFKGPDWTLERTPGVPRILCLGGSTTAGGNSAGEHGSYPHYLDAVLRERLGGQFEVMNAGMSAWTSAEMVAAWFLDLIDYRPDLVILHEAVNDVEPRKLGGFRRDYSHYRRAFVAERFDPFTRWLADRSDLWLWLVNRHTPTIVDMTVIESPLPVAYSEATGFPDGTLEPYRRNLHSIGKSVEAYGGTPVFMTLIYDPAAEERNEHLMYRTGIQDNNQVMRELAAEEGWGLCDLWTLERERADEWRPRFIDLVHVTPAGNRIKAERLATALIEQGLLARDPGGTPTPPAR